MIGAWSGARCANAPSSSASVAVGVGERAVVVAAALARRCAARRSIASSCAARAGASTRTAACGRRSCRALRSIPCARRASSRPLGSISRCSRPRCMPVWNFVAPEPLAAHEARGLVAAGGEPLGDHHVARIDPQAPSRRRGRALDSAAARSSSTGSIAGSRCSARTPNRTPCRVAPSSREHRHVGGRRDTAACDRRARCRS